MEDFFDSPAVRKQAKEVQGRNLSNEINFIKPFLHGFCECFLGVRMSSILEWRNYLIKMNIFQNVQEIFRKNGHKNYKAKKSQSFNLILYK